MSPSKVKEVPATSSLVPPREEFDAYTTPHRAGSATTRAGGATFNATADSLVTLDAEGFGRGVRGVYSDGRALKLRDLAPVARLQQQPAQQRAQARQRERRVHVHRRREDRAPPEPQKAAHALRHEQRLNL